MSFLWVALGGAIGAMCRYAISLIPVKTTFPVLTLMTNIMGAVLIGLIVGIAMNNKNVPPQLILFLRTGVCGGFTTFSTFSLEAYNLFERKVYGQGAAYVALSVLGCIAGVWCGRSLAMMIRR
jgi:CrcB protein